MVAGDGQNERLGKKPVEGLKKAVDVFAIDGVAKHEGDIGAAILERGGQAAIKVQIGDDAKFHRRIVT